MSDVIWETFDGFFKTVHRLSRHIEELEGRVVEMERRLKIALGPNDPPPITSVMPRTLDSIPAPADNIVNPAAPPVRSQSGYVVMRGEDRLSFLAYAKPLTEEEFNELTAWVIAQPELGPGTSLVWKESEDNA